MSSSRRFLVLLVLVLPATSAASQEAEVHWSFRSPTRPEPPALAALQNAERVRNPIDRVVLVASQQLGLQIGQHADPQLVGAHAVDRSSVTDGEDVLVIGAGPIGLAVTQFAQIAGGQVTVLDINPRRLAFCRDLFGVGRTILSGEDGREPIEQVTEALAEQWGMPVVNLRETTIPPKVLELVPRVPDWAIGSKQIHGM